MGVVYGMSGLPKGKRVVTSVKTNYKKLKGEVGMAVPKSKQTRVVGIITSLYIPTLAF